MSPIDRAERICNEFGVTLSAVEGAQDVWETDESIVVEAAQDMIDKLQALGCTTTSWSAPYRNRYVRIDLSDAMREWRASEYGAQTGSVHL